MTGIVGKLDREEGSEDTFQVCMDGCANHGTQWPQKRARREYERHEVGFSLMELWVPLRHPGGCAKCAADTWSGSQQTGLS